MGMGLDQRKDRGRDTRSVPLGYATRSEMKRIDIHVCVYVCAYVCLCVSVSVLYFNLNPSAACCLLSDLTLRPNTDVQCLLSDLTLRPNTDVQ